MLLSRWSSLSILRGWRAREKKRGGAGVDSSDYGRYRGESKAKQARFDRGNQLTCLRCDFQDSDERPRERKERDERMQKLPG